MVQLNTGVEENSILRVYCFGRFRIQKPGDPLPVGVGSRHKMWSLFKFLVSRKGIPLPTQTIMETFWPKVEDPTDTSALRTAVCRLRANLEPKRAIYSRASYVICTKDTCAFNINTPFWLDLDEFEKLIAKAHRIGIGDKAAGIELYLKAIDLYEGDFLSEDLYQEWTVIPREHYRRLFLDAVKEAAVWSLEIKGLLTARAILERGLEIDPLVEDLHALLMRTLIELGDKKAAVQHYTYSTGMLYRELGSKPSSELKRLYQQIREGEGLPEKEKLTLIEKEDGPFVCTPELFRNLLALEKRRIARNGGEATLVIMELNQRGVVRQQKGNAPAGDLEAIVRECLRKSDIVCRLDERHLAILLPSTGLAGSKVTVANIRNLFETRSEENEYKVSAKIESVRESVQTYEGFTKGLYPMIGYYDGSLLVESS